MIACLPHPDKCDGLHQGHGVSWGGCLGVEGGEGGSACGDSTSRPVFDTRDASGASNSSNTCSSSGHGGGGGGGG
eukprot:scaffold189816_cov17-Tisochrysis_lutea.AAC.1